VPRSRRRARRDEEDQRTPEDLERLIVELEEEMFAAAEDLRFEYAAKLRDEIRELRRELELTTGRAASPG
jgi:excinuclease ABC subunit B